MSPSNQQPGATSRDAIACPADPKKVLDLYFLEHRAKLLDVAAFLDRLDRSSTASGETETASRDHRVEALHRALRVLLEDQPGRTERIHLIFSDPTDEPIPEATTQSASGAYPGTPRSGGEA